MATPVSDSTTTSMAGLTHLGVQALVTAMIVKFTAGMMSHSVAAVAPEITSQLHIDYSFIGIYTALTYAGACISTLIGGNFIRKFGAALMCIFFLLAYIVSLWLCLVDISWIIVATGFLLGLGKGSVGPATNAMIAHHAGKKHINFLFSLKQAAEPLGIALAGLLVPYLAVQFDWQISLVGASIIGILGALWCLYVRKGQDTFAVKSQKIDPKSLGESFKMVISNWALLRLASLSIWYKGLAITVFAYLVTFLVHEHFPLQWAGVALAISTAGMIVGRLFWGWLADTIHSSKVVLALCGILMGVATIALAQITGEMIVAIDFLIVFCVGFTSKGWNGVFFAQVALHSPEGRVSQATGGTDFFTDVGATLIPFIFSLLVKYWNDDYRLTFYLIAATTIITGFFVFFMRTPKDAQVPAKKA